MVKLIERTNGSDIIMGGATASEFINYLKSNNRGIRRMYMTDLHDEFNDFIDQKVVQAEMWFEDNSDELLDMIRR